jgi:hypothetical protein
VRLGRWRPHLLAMQAWAPQAPLRALMAWQAPQGRPGRRGRWPLPGPDRRPSEPRGRASRLEGLALLRPGGRPVPLAAEGLPDAVELPLGPAQVERWTALQDAVSLPRVPGPVERRRGAVPRWVRLPGSAHRGLVRPEVTRRVMGGQSAVAMARLWALAPQVAVLPQPLGGRQTRRCTRRSGPGYQPQAPWRDRRDRQWRN